MSPEDNIVNTLSEQNLRINLAGSREYLEGLLDKMTGLSQKRKELEQSDLTDPVQKEKMSKQIRTENDVLDQIRMTKETIREYETKLGIGEKKS